MPKTSNRTETATRVDTAHKPETANGIRIDDEPSREVLSSIAGLNGQTQENQFKTHAKELASHLQERLELLDEREAELNARLAVVDQEERIARIRELPGFDFLEEQDARDTLSSVTSPTPYLDTPEGGVALKKLRARIARDQAKIAKSSDQMCKDSLSQDKPSTTFDTIGEPWQRSRQEATLPKPSPEQRLPRTMETEPGQSFATPSAIAEENQQLKDRHDSLNRKQLQLEKLHDEITKLHREALEMRIATEQAWTQMATLGNDSNAAETLAGLRRRLDDNYRVSNDELTRRHSEVQEVRTHIQEQEARLRIQIRDAQLWIDRRWNELEARDANLSVRETEVDQRETEFDRQARLWQRQREEYRYEIEELSQRLRLSNSSASVAS